MSRESTLNGRRRFLQTAAVAGGAATVATVTGAAVAATQEDVPTARSDATAAPASKGYHVTPHIDTYYRLARQ